MELPQNLKDLYRHWELHTMPAVVQAMPPQDIDTELLNEIEKFALERISIWKKKTLGERTPFTHDLILQNYRFCNIFREFDRQTIEFHTTLNPYRDNFPLWLLNMFYFRLVANTETIKTVGLLSFEGSKNKEFLERFLASPRPRFGTPYVFPVSTIIRSSTPTREEFIALYLPTIMNSVAEEISSWQKISVCEGVKKATKIFGYNLNFLWTEVLIDVAYQFPEHIDLFKQFPIGPGSAPTMKRLNYTHDPSLLVTELSRVQFDVGITFNNRPLRLSAENWEGIGCEFRKYTNLSLGKGRKRRYK